MTSSAECILKADNYAAAARLFPSPDGQWNYIRLAALWRVRAMKLSALQAADAIVDAEMYSSVDVMPDGAH